MTLMGRLTSDYSESKKCPDCGEVKPLVEFTLSRKNRDGRGTYCRLCFNERSRRHRERRAELEGREIRRRVAAPAGFKYCARCEQIKALEAFGRNRATRDGLTTYCRGCHNKVGREAKIRLYGGTREYHLRSRYGITGADFDAMVDAQGGKCAVCDHKPEHVDHDHKSGRVRGVLCFNCNQALGNVRDDVRVLDGLIRYLGNHRLSLLRLMPAESPVEDVVFEVACRHLSA